MQISDQIPDNVTSLEPVRQDTDKLKDEEKQERVRIQLLDAAARLIAGRGIDSTTINELASEASVTPGAFHACFADINALLDELAAAVVAGVAANTALRLRARDPAQRVARVVRAHLRCARDDRQWARLLVWFFSRPAFPVRAALLKGIEDDVLDGIGKGQFSAEPDEAALDLLMGTLLLGVSRVAGGHVGRDYDHNLTANILRGLGMVSAAALERVQRDI